MSDKTLTVDSELFVVEAAHYAHRSDIIASVTADGPRYDFDRAGAVSLIEALTAAVEAADAREAAEARKLKRGDKVVEVRTSRRLHLTVISDEDENGQVDVVVTEADHLSHGRIWEWQPAYLFSRA